MLGRTDGTLPAGRPGLRVGRVPVACETGGVPTEPPESAWLFPPVDEADEYGVVAFGADLEPGTLLAAYRQGLFPMHVQRRRLGWWSPDPRAVLPRGGLRVSRSLRRSLRRFEVRVDTAFTEVMQRCGDPRRAQGWINRDIVAAYRRLFDLGWAHSVETWLDGELVGGLYGVAVGGLFAGESMFHRVDDASKVALVALVELLDDHDATLLDCQWRTEHLATLGVV
ncbi:MAG: leucyl/phenylalanyl-tRNA--protein transferase, partial [Actinobacteria bacterium]|nr:leucyl/phenylalanyl-tRNA--protein transferase [Actinomycetota bacterium]